MGGYGYFNNYDKILFFDENRNNEWFLYETKNYIPDPSNVFLNYHDRVNNHIYYFGGLYHVQTKSVGEKASPFPLLSSGASVVILSPEFKWVETVLKSPIYLFSIE